MIRGQRYLPLHEFMSILGDRCGKLISMHVLTGCDTVNSVYGVSKPKAHKKLGHEILAAVGVSFNTLPSMNEIDLYGIERFQCTMNQPRYKLSAERSPSERVITTFWHYTSWTSQTSQLPGSYMEISRSS